MSDFFNPEISDYNSFGVAVYGFNLLAGNLTPLENGDDVLRRLENQAQRILEEAQEVVDAIQAMKVEGHDEEECLTGVLDGVVDTLVTSFGLLQMAGPYFNISEAASRICANNISKFTTDREKAEASVKDIQEYGVDCYLGEQEVPNVGTVYGVIRRSDDKVLKPTWHVPVDLSGCLYLEEEGDD